MSGKNKCKNCGSSDIEVDPARGDAVCTNCGTVLEDNIIVAEVEFQENTHGGHSALGQFVSAESKGGATGFGGAFNIGAGQESREVTLKKAKNGITALCQQLRLNQQCIDMACNFFKMALSRSLTKGRPASHIHAACVYITCRTEGTPHLLIDISDALQICCYQLGRTYLRLSRSLCINIPSMDPCLYILRFAAQLQFGDKKHEVSNTALRLVQRMKRDSIHSGRRPSGLCGAALLIAARLHQFSRSPADVVRIVKVHESTLRKRMLEFGETPSSALTLDEFMSVDLEEEQDPPAFRAARKRDKERLQKLLDEDGGALELTELQKEIEVELEKENAKKKKKTAVLQKTEKFAGANTEDIEAEQFALQETLEALGESLGDEELNSALRKDAMEKGLGPDLKTMGLGIAEDRHDTFVKPNSKAQHFTCPDLTNDELIMSDHDEEDVASMIIPESEAIAKTKRWNMLHAGYLKEQKIKQELREREREEGKDKKKKVRGSYKKKTQAQGGSAGEVIGKMIQEKRISNKINYDILKALDNEMSSNINPPTPSSPSPNKKRRMSQPLNVPSPAVMTPVVAPSTPAPDTPATPAVNDEEDYEEELEPVNEMESLSAMLHSNQDEEDYDYEEY